MDADALAGVILMLLLRYGVVLDAVVCALVLQRGSQLLRLSDVTHFRREMRGVVSELMRLMSRFLVAVVRGAPARITTVTSLSSLLLLRVAGELAQNSLRDWDHHGGGGHVGDPHRQKGGCGHEAEEQPSWFCANFGQHLQRNSFVQIPMFDSYCHR